MQSDHSEENTKSVKTYTSKEVLDLILTSLDEEKGEDVVHVDLRGKSEIGDYMVIASGRSSRQVSALSEKLAERLKHAFGIISRVEGKESGDWVLLDSHDVIVHLFRPEVREFYQLEKMWLHGISEHELPTSPSAYKPSE